MEANYHKEEFVLIINQLIVVLNLSVQSYHRVQITVDKSSKRNVN